MKAIFDFATMQIGTVSVMENCYDCDSGDGGGDGAGDGSGGGCDNS